MGPIGTDRNRANPSHPCSIRSAARRFDHRQHRLDEAAASGALSTEGPFPPDDRVPQGALTGVVRRLDLLLQERPQPRPVIVQLTVHAHEPRVAAEQPAQQQTFHRAADWL
jgi:hypothetical protein